MDAMRRWGVTGWSYLQLEIIADDRLIRPTIGPAGLTREQAHAEIQWILDQTADFNPALAPVADLWRRGAKDDTVYAGPFTWAIFPHTGTDPMPAARAWVADFAQTMRAAGLDVQIGWPR